jgi:hypothetical protein
MPSSVDTLLHDRRELLTLLERLHRHKDAAYGDAWRKRGEVIAIFSNMARKYDRLLVAFDEKRPAATEPLADTVADLCVYAAKYLTWIADEHPRDLGAAGLPFEPSAIAARRGPAALEALFAALGRYRSLPPATSSKAWTLARSFFEALERALMAQATPDAPPEEMLGYTDQATLAWRLTGELSWLLVLREREQGNVFAKLRGDVDDMDQAASA